MNETIQTIRTRRSIRKFSQEQVPDEMAELVLEAGRIAPCSMNRQERHFTVIQSKELLDLLNREAKAFAVHLENRYLSLMAQSENFNIFYSAPLVIVVSGPEKRSMVESDCAAAIQNMLLAAESLGLGGCWINFILFAFQGANAEENLSKLGLPDGYVPFGSISVGYKDDEPAGEREIRGNTVNFIL